uniref:Uncharacterized protein n=1 Tax=Setaria viridis TaxID=4556 RepID=A0A4U6TZS5_SETVI|nr:hypothetical protein SEVIR_7G013810v2 [Setaria viridis]
MLIGMGTLFSLCIFFKVHVQSGHMNYCNEH